MSLTGRLSLLLLGVLALVLAGFSSGLYLLAQDYLARQDHDRLKAALDVLAVGVKVGKDEVEWEGKKRAITLGQDAGPDQVRWLVRNEGGKILGRSGNLAGGPVSEFLSAAADPQQATVEVSDAEGRAWRLEHRFFQPARPRSAKKLPEAGKNRREESEDEERGESGQNRHASQLVLTAGLCLEPAQSALHTLAGMLMVLSAGLWLLTAFLCRFLCRRALVPLTAMAATARGMTGTDWACLIDCTKPTNARGDSPAMLPTSSAPRWRPSRDRSRSHSFPTALRKNIARSWRCSSTRPPTWASWWKCCSSWRGPMPRPACPSWKP
jgi:two-component system, OmpR family, sensor kinase